MIFRKHSLSTLSVLLGFQKYEDIFTQNQEIEKKKKEFNLITSDNIRYLGIFLAK